MASARPALQSEDCKICCKFLRKYRVPICAHVFCYNYLIKQERNNAVKCPKCRASTEESAEKQPNNLPRRVPRKTPEESEMDKIKHWKIDFVITDVVFDQECHVLYIATGNKTRPIHVLRYYAAKWGTLSTNTVQRYCGLTLDSKRGLMVALNADQMVSFDRKGMNVDIMSSTHFRLLENIAYHPGNDKYIVADTSQHCLYYVDPVSGQVVKTIPAMAPGEIGADTIMSISCDRSGASSVWATSDWDANIVRFYNSDGSCIKAYQGKGNGYGQWYNPDGICFDNQGSLIVCDTNNNRLVRLTPNANDKSQEWHVLLSTARFGLGNPRNIDITKDGIIALSMYDNVTDGPYTLALFAGYKELNDYNSVHS